MILALAGGVGGAKLARGLADVLAPDRLVIVVNTGDDFEHLGVHVSPDLDTVLYTLAGVNNVEQGWGLAGETWHFMQALEALGGETWFRLGDRDLGTNVVRTQRLRAGETLSDVTAYLCERFGVRHHLAPMSDAAVRTLVHTDAGVLEFQDYFVRRRAEPAVRTLSFGGAEQAHPSGAFQRALSDPGLEAVVICPSNPYLSIAPLLALPGIRSALERRRAPVVAVSPIVGGQAITGPAAKIMRELGKEPSVLEVARFYQGLIDGLVIDQCDASYSGVIEHLGIGCLATSSVMRVPEDRAALARATLEFAGSLRTSPARRSA